MRNTSRAKGRGRLMLLALGVVGTVSMTAGSLSLALFTDQETVEGTFSSGTIILDDVQIDGLVLTTANMMPGDSVTDAVVVENDGSASLRYSISAASVDADLKDLQSQLTVTVKTGVTTCTTAGFAVDGTAVRSTVALTDSTVIFGSATAGSQAGDRTLAATASETLCFQINLPLATGNAYQGASTTTTFTFDAEQTANN